MKSRLFVCAMLLGWLAVPAFADSLSFTNSGILSGDLSSGVTSAASNLTLDGTTIIKGQFGTVELVLGSFTTGSLQSGGTFTGGTFELEGAVSLVSPFSGTWTEVSSGLYDLVGSISTGFGGVQYTGTTTQQFTLSFDDGEILLKDVSGTTSLTLNPIVVPEPGTLALLGTGLAGVAGAARKKLRRSVS